MALKRIGLIIGIVAIIGGAFALKQLGSNDRTDFYLKDEFDTLNTENWYVGEWGTGFPKNDKVVLKDGILTARVNETDRGPFMLSKPIEVKANSLITIKRKVKLSYGNNQFTGGLSLIQTDQKDVEPIFIDKDWYKNFGEPFLLMEYVHTTDQDAKRPGNHNFRLLVPDWETTENYALADPIFGEWFEETLTFDCNTGRVTYTNGGKMLVLKGYRPSKPYVRIFMHPYGFYTGHEMKLDWVEIKVTQPNQ